MRILQLKPTKLSTVLTTLDPTLPVSIDDQRIVLSQWSKILPRVLVIGPLEPPRADGVSHIKTGNNPPMANLLRTYMQRIPGAELCMVAAPDFLINEHKIDRFIDRDNPIRMEMAWACHLDLNGEPRAFIMSSPVVAHLVNDLPPSSAFSSNWRTIVHDWMQKLLRQRYLDFSGYGLISDLPKNESPFISLAELGQIIVQNQKPAPVQKKQSVVKKLKLTELGR